VQINGDSLAHFTLLFPLSVAVVRHGEMQTRKMHQIPGSQKLKMSTLLTHNAGPILFSFAGLTAGGTTALLGR